MGEINIPRHEQDALRAVDADVLDKLIEQAAYEETPSALQHLRLANCGPYVASRLRAFEQALKEHGNAKFAQKRNQTEDDVRSAGSDLAHAVQQMKQRMETEEKEGQLFYVDDQLIQPYSFSERLTVRVGYRWRRKIEDDWLEGRITFFHEVDSRPDYTIPATKRKPSAAKLRQDRQDKLSRTWMHLMELALHSVKEYFREGGDGNTMPLTFQATTDPYTRGLNNYSAQFWREQP
ncbi:hypothetical protein PS925_04498 [Pseudomonas fluorescens]|uniref:Uncharacterized protein n=1 Tax=Pseudomonas fluorescens TaxID=294 RepID=A0A5E7V747_PSEFL|nr:hypothetical protein [Pseudomonas fluorescens]VVQ18829.1 hypothetical protein PS925_04498 [Pseudomonas fluorescens]